VACGSGAFATLSDSPPAIGAAPLGKTAAKAALLKAVGEAHLGWLAGLWRQYSLQQGPLRDPDGAVLGTPLFWFRHPEGARWACFGESTPDAEVVEQLREKGVSVLSLGGSVD